jgi:hypothetical protein
MERWHMLSRLLCTEQESAPFSFKDTLVIKALKEKDKECAEHFKQGVSQM